MLCFLTVSSVTKSSAAISRFALPAATSRRTSSSRSLRASINPGMAAGSRPRGGALWQRFDRRPYAAEVSERHSGCLQVLPARGDEPPEHGGQRGALVGEDPDVTLGLAEAERLGQGVHRAGLLAGCRQGQCPERLDLDDAARPALGRRQRTQPVQQRDRLVGQILREEHARQHQILRLAGVAHLVVRAQAALVRPADGRDEVALGQQQPSPLSAGPG